MLFAKTRKKYNFYLEIITYNLWPLDIYTMDYPKSVVLNQKEESLSA